MGELNYSKKQLAPLISKFAINVEKNSMFKDIINLFSDSPNYHVWAVKVVFSNVATFDDLQAIKSWADHNSDHIHQLTKNGNITSYSTKSEIRRLFVEMGGIDRINNVKTAIHLFNTDQRRILETETGVNTISPQSAAEPGTKFDEWHRLLNGFRKLHKDKRHKLASNLSAIRDVSQIKEVIKNGLKQSYLWDKDDLLAFVEANLPFVNVVYDNGPIVILEIPNYEASNTLCAGRTGWCLTTSSDRFKQYVTSIKGNKQFFYFDFDLPEKHELAHIGFTINPRNGITNAHSTNNTAMAQGAYVSVEGKHYTIEGVLSDKGINYRRLMSNTFLKKNAWTMAVFKGLASNTKGAKIVYEKNNILVLEISSKDAINAVAGFAFIPMTDHLDLSSKSKLFLIYDFNKDVENADAFTSISFNKDRYGFLAVGQMYDGFGSVVDEKKYFSKTPLSIDDFVDRSGIDPNILLHKYIIDGDEKRAIKHLESNFDKIDINYVFEDVSTAYAAIDAHMFKLFMKIIEHPKFDGNKDNGFGDNIIQTMLWSCYVDETVKMTKKEAETMHDIISNMVNSGSFDLNHADYSGETILIIASRNKNMLWLVERLVNDPSVNVSAINDANLTAFGEALRCKNTEAAALIGRRPDLKITEEDKAMANANKIKFVKFIKPSEMAAASASHSAKKKIDPAICSELMAKVLS